MHKLSEYARHAMGESRPFGREKTKNGPSQLPNIGITSLWEDLEAKLLTPGELLENTPFGQNVAAGPF